MAHPNVSGGRSDTGGNRDDRYDQVYIAVVTLGGKVDALIQTQAIRDETIHSEFRRLREDIARDRTEFSRDHADHENRIRKIEERRYVEPKTVWTAFGFTLTFGSLIVAIINLITR